jgi:hypothetical protein
VKRIFVFFAVIFCCAVYCCAVAFAHDSIPSSCFVFCDTPVTGVKENVKSWSANEKAEVQKTLLQCFKAIPTIVARACLFKPICLYRETENNSAFDMYAFSDRNNINLFVLDRYFEAPAKNFLGNDYQLWVISHELGHLADAGHVIDESVEWNETSASILSRAKSLISTDMSSNQKWKTAVQSGVPSLVALQNGRELLAEYVAARCLRANVTEPQEVRALLDQTLFSNTIGFKYGDLNLEQFFLNNLQSDYPQASAITDQNSGLEFFKSGAKHEHKGDWADAVRDYSFACCITPNRQSYREALSYAHLRCAEKLLKGNSHAVGDVFDQVIAHLRDAVLADPHNKVAKELLFDSLQKRCNTITSST